MKRITYLFCFIFILLHGSEKSYACDCINISSEEAFRKNDVVFEGKVLEVQNDSSAGAAVLFEIKKIWKGTSSSQIIIYTGGGSCAFPFTEGGEYIVFSSRSEGEKQLHTSSCSGTKRLDEAGDEKVSLNHIAKATIPTKKENLIEDMPNHFHVIHIAIFLIGTVFVIGVFILFMRKVRKK
ncbi:cobalamin biosynthesis protein CbiN [Bacillus cereus]|nr:cobalamin biosynthesis protein CbiN [Bacillus cereus]PGU68973.1 cobalamin biosynthesis protein CbiN [Bacillus cereus]